MRRRECGRCDVTTQLCIVAHPQPDPSHLIPDLGAVRHGAAMHAAGS